MAVQYIATRGTDGTAGSISPETVALSGVGTGTQLVLVYNHGGGNGDAAEPGYVTPTDWTFVGAAYNNVNSAGTDYFASTVVYTKVAAGDTTVSLGWTGPHLGRGRATVYEFSAAQVSQVGEFEGAPGPISPGQLTDVGQDSSILFAATTAAPTGSPPVLTETALNGFTTIISSTDTTYKRHNSYRNLSAGTVDLPVLTNTDDGATLYPYAAVAVVLSGNGMFPQAIFL